MKSLKELLVVLNEKKVSGSSEVNVHNIVDDSRKVERGSMFVAIKGLTKDGSNFIEDAVKKGASVIVGENDASESKLGKSTYIQVKNSRKALSLLASAWHGYPSRKLKVIGVTGTDGKTTTATIIWWLLNQGGLKTGLISTVGARIGNKQVDLGFHVTNPEPLELQALLKKIYKAGCEYVVLEVTSHGLQQERVAGINFDLAVLTNITHEHLDYHKTFKRYQKSKIKLFKNASVSILNKNDSSLRVLEKQLKKKEVIRYSKSLLRGGVLNSVNTRFSENYNKDNAAAATLVAQYLGIEDFKISKAIRSFPGVRGRMQKIKNLRGFKIFIDFAHTPNSLKSALTYLKSTKKKRLISVFGSAGDRDTKKRAMMGKVAGQLADVIVLTSEDPREENVKSINKEIKSGIKNSDAEIYETTERGEAIYFAINKIAKRGDIVAIFGKGHEKSIAYRTTEYPWSDEKAVKMSLDHKILRTKRPVAILGFGLEGKDLTFHLLKSGFIPYIFDQKEAEELSLENLNLKRVKIFSGKDYLNYDFTKFDLIFRSPGIYRYSPKLLEAEKSGVYITSAIKEFFEKSPAKIIGVTGTKGKGTTSTLIYKILKKAGKDVYLAGNIGKPYLSLLPKLNKDSIVILEISSFQLIDIVKSPHVAVVLNITVDHLDWHKNRKEYFEAKTNILKYQKKNDFAVINNDYKSIKKLSSLTAASKYFFSKRDKTKGTYVKNNKIILSTQLKEYLVGDIKNLHLKGRHNWENITAAITTSRLLGASIKAIKEATFEFKGLEHRLELVRKVKGISFYNDSFATGPQPTIAAIKSFTQEETLILGGSEKYLDYSILAKEIKKRKNLKTILLIGEVAHKIKALLVKVGYNGKILDMGYSKMDKIVNISYTNTRKGGVVLLSPAAAFFDMFTNYKDRGTQFKFAVNNL